MPVPSTLADIDPVAANNSPPGSEAVSTNIDNYLRTGFAFIAQLDDNKLETTTAASTYQPLDALLTSLAGQTTAANKVQAYSASDTALLLDFKDEDDMASNSATAIPSQQSVKAYVGTYVGTAVAATYPTRAWVSFDGTKNAAGSADLTNTNRYIRGSGNVSSVLRNATGDYTISFTSSLSDENYAVQVTPQGTVANVGLFGCVKVSVAPTSSAVRVSIHAVDAGLRDSEYVNVLVIR